MSSVPSFKQLSSLEEIEDFVREGYRASGDPRSRWNRGAPPLGYGFEWGKLPLPVAEPGPLIEHAVLVAGSAGLTLQQVREVFARLGADRLDAGLKFARTSGQLVERSEMRPNRAGRQQRQVVLYAAELAPGTAT